MKYHVTSLPIREVIHDLSEAIGGRVKMDGNYYSLAIPSEVGGGSISGLDFGQGLGMINYRCVFHRDTDIHFDLNTVHPLKFVYLAAGRVSHRFVEEDKHREVGTYQNLVVASRRKNGHVLYFHGGCETHLCSVEIDRVRFSERFIGKFAVDETLFQDLLTDTTARRQFCYEGEYAIRISQLIEEVFSFGRGGVMRSMFLEGKAYDILISQWLQYLDDKDRTEDRQVLRRASLKRINHCKEYIDRHLKADLTTTALSQQSGLSTAELQQGFQYATGLTVNQYVRERRLQRGLELLQDGNHNVSETLYEIGFSSLSYFSRKFKERWGVSPSALRRASNRTSEEEE